MIDLVFQRLVIRDFKAFRGDHTLTLDRPAGLYFVRGRNDDEPTLGSNGASKSSLWDAVCWCLYGRTPSDLRNPDVKPWKMKKPDTRVGLRLWIRGKQHTIQRSIAPNLLYVNGKEATAETVLKLIRIPFAVMVNTIILPQDEDLFFDRTPSEKMKLLSDVKNLDRWDARSKAAADDARKLELEESELQGEITGLDQAVKSIEKVLLEANDQAAEWQLKFDVRAAEAKKFERKHGKRLAELQKAVDGYDLKYDGAMTELKACERQVAQLSGDVKSAEQNLSRMREKRSTTTQRIEHLQLELDKLRTAETCPTCGQAIVTGDIERHTKEIALAIKNHETALKVLRTKPLKASLETATSNLANAEKYLATFHTRADSAISDHKKAQAELSDLKARLKAIERAHDEGETNPHVEQARSLRKKVKRLGRDKEGAEEDLRLCRRELERSKFWIKGFKDIKLDVIEELLQELELTTVGMLEEVGLIGWTVKYVIERETQRGTTARRLDVLIGSPRSRGLVKWQSWSGGERQRLRIVGTLALATVLLNHAGVSPSFEVLDEPIQNLSDEGVHDLCAYLAERARAMDRTIFYCDHASVDSARFAGTILIRKDRDGARIARGAKA
jgi:DNA repair exonuclease SbcCD ATPase subunit